MPDPKKYKDKDSFMKACIPMVLDEGTAKDNDQAVAVCSSMWTDRSHKPKLEQRQGANDMKPERRYFQLSELRIQRKDESDHPKIVGYAAVFDSLSEDLGGFREKIAQGAFKNSISRGDDVRALFNHDSNYVLGRSLSNTLNLNEDRKGLRIEIDPPDTQFSNDLLVSIGRGDISQMSFGFYTKSDTWEESEDKKEVTRTLNEVDLVDVSPVTFPAYPETQVALRSMDKWKQQHSDADLDSNLKPSGDGSHSEEETGAVVPKPSVTHLIRLNQLKQKQLLMEV